jgi:DNA-binding MarR family transcriptional regulator
LYENGPLTPSQIAKCILVKPSTMTGIVDRLEQKGFVKRARTSSDRRVITIDLTEGGRHLVREGPPPIQRRIIDGLKRIPQGEIELIVLSLTRLTDMLDV